ncbi:MAG: sulfotransferase, partial [Bacteroidota bacterium]
MNKKPALLKGPVVIGGVGGSGTRVIAKILQELNFFIGNDLNEPLDNLSYTLLFKRPKWYVKNKDRQEKIGRGLRIHEKSMTCTNSFSPAEHLFLFQATCDMYLNGHNIYGDGRGKWAIKRYRNLLFPGHHPKEHFSGWGWKEPNSHLLLEYLNDFFPGLKYIHTMRNGLDMAFSQNQQQLFNWGNLFGVPVPGTQAEIPEASFRYWAAVHRYILQQSACLGAEKFLMINFDTLCREPEKEIRKLLTFLKVRDEQLN